MNYIGGVYVDVDRDYFNDNSAGENYATIDINPGYQKLCGQDALDYVRYRHTDNDLVRAARQQDFLRQAKNAAGVRKLLASGSASAGKLIHVFGRYFRVDKSLRANRQVSRCCELVLYLVNEARVNEVTFQVAERRTRSSTRICTPRRASCARPYREFMQRKELGAPRETPKRTRDRESRAARRARARTKSAPVAGLEDARRRGRGPGGDRRCRKLKFPFYFPRKRVARARATRATAPRIYTIKDERGKKREAYRLVLSHRAVGEYYGVQGLAWKRPPILDDPDRRSRSRRPQAPALLRRRAAAARRAGRRSAASTGSRTRSRRRSARTQMLEHRRARSSGSAVGAEP